MEVLGTIARFIFRNKANVGAPHIPTRTRSINLSCRVEPESSGGQIVDRAVSCPDPVDPESSEFPLGTGWTRERGDASTNFQY